MKKTWFIILLLIVVALLIFLGVRATDFIFDDQDYDDRYNIFNVSNLTAERIESDNFFGTLSGLANNSDKLDGIDSTQFLRSDINDTLEAYYLYPNGTNPILLDHLVNKEFVELAVAGLELDYFFTNATSDIPGYFVLNNTDRKFNQSIIQSFSLSSGDNQLIFNFSTEAGLPFIFLSEGIYDAHIHLDKTGGAAQTIFPSWTLSKRNSSGEFVIMISEIGSTEITTTEQIFDLHSVFTQDVHIVDTDRLVFKLFVDITGGGSSTVRLYMEGRTDSHFTFRTPTSTLEEIFIRRDGRTPLTANWNVGGFDLTNLGNVGIGTTTPTHKLEVVGDVNISGGNDLFVSDDLTVTDTGTFSKVTVDDVEINLGLLLADGDLAIGSKFGDVDITAGGGDVTMDSTLVIKSTLSLDSSGITSSSGVIDFVGDDVITTASGTFGSLNVDTLKLNNSDISDSTGTVNILDNLNATENATFGGNVGIGISIPTEELHVVGDGNVSVDFYVGDDLTVNNDGEISGVLGVGKTHVNGGLDVVGYINVDETTDSLGRLLRLKKVNYDLSTGDGKLLFDVSGWATTFGSDSFKGATYNIQLNDDTLTQSGTTNALAVDMRSSGTGIITGIATANDINILWRNTGATTNLKGSNVLIDVRGDGSTAHTVARASAFEGFVRTVDSGATITNAYGFYSARHRDLGGTITNGYGVYVEDQNQAVNNWAIYTNAGDVRIGGDTTFHADVNATNEMVLGSPVNIKNITMFTNPSGNPACCGVMDDFSWGCTNGAC